MDKKKKAFILLALVMALALGVKACTMHGADKQQTTAGDVSSTSAYDPSLVRQQQYDALRVLLADDNMTRPAKRIDATPDSDNVSSLSTRRLPGSFREIFCDSNDLQLVAARANGVGAISTLRSAYNLAQPLVKIQSCNAFSVDTLKYSMPFLVPKAALLLRDIGLAFSDSVRARGGGECRIRVTSLTRSDFTVKHLARRNRNASLNSCHRFGTTFDISWIHFDCLDPRHIVNEGDMKNTLAEVLYEMRRQGRCYVMWERKQSCFHITVR